MNVFIRYKNLGWMLPLMMAASANAANPAANPAADPADSVDAATCACTGEYSIINLGPDAGVTFLNRNGQAGFSSFMPEGVLNFFYDGRRVHNLGSLGGTYTSLNGINNNGVVVGESEDAAQPFSNITAYTWTVAEGMRALPTPIPSGASASAVNDSHQVVGQVPAPNIIQRASVWTPDRRLVSLGPVPPSYSAVAAINANGVSTGSADLPDGAIHAMLWGPSGRPRDLGSLGGATTFGLFINDNTQVAGMAERNGRPAAFFWSAASGMVPIGAEGQARLLAGLNRNGEIAGSYEGPAGSVPYLWSQGRGLRRVPLGGAPQGDLTGLNNARVMVGSVERGPGGWRDWRAVLWRGLANPVDLTSRLYRPPTGLILHSAGAINDNGIILAHSNAGLVLLRPGRQGGPAPVLGPLRGDAPQDAVALNQTVDFSVGFVDSSSTETHAASVSTNDGCATSAPSVRETRGVGEVTLRHTFCQAGYYTVKVRVRDSAGYATEVRRDLWVIDPDAPALIGNGTLPAMGAQAARSSGAPLRFAVWAPLRAPSASAAQRSSPARGFVTLGGPFHFRGEIAGTPQRDGGAVRLAGSGRWNGRPGYRFELDAVDGKRQGGATRLRMRISHTDRVTRAEVVDFDNGSAASGQAVVGQGELRLAE